MGEKHEDFFFLKMRKDGNGKATMTGKRDGSTDEVRGGGRERERGDSAQAESTARVTRLTPSADHSCDHSLWRSAQCAASASRLRVGLIAFRGEEFRIEMSILGSRVASVKELFSCTRIMYKGEK